MRARLLTLLSRRIAAGRADTSLQRNLEFIRWQLLAIARYTSYFTPEVRGLDRLPAEGAVLVAGNHTCLFYLPGAWTCGQAIISRRGIGVPTYLLAYDLLFAGIPRRNGGPGLLAGTRLSPGHPGGGS